MPLPSRAERLRAYDCCRREFIQDCAERFECGARLAAEDTRTLDELACEIAGAVMAWSAPLARLELAAEGRFDLRRAADLVVEAVFDERLSPTALRLLSAALELEALEA